MAKYKTPIEINGTLGDLVYYTLNGVNVVRRKSGFNTQSYQQKESYEAVRQNSSEFGHCSKAGKTLREALKEYLSHANDKYLYQKVARLMTTLKDLDQTQGKGKRRVYNGITTQMGKAALRKFQFGEIPCIPQAITLSTDLFETYILLPYSTFYDSLEIVVLNANFDTYTCSSKTLSFDLKPKQSRIALAPYREQEVEPSRILYFLSLRKGTKLVAMGLL